MQDDDSGLVYAGARYLDPIIGRFLSIDPDPVEAGKPQTFNRYASANNNPFKFTDPSGKSADDEVDEELPHSSSPEENIVHITRPIMGGSGGYSPESEKFKPLAPSSLVVSWASKIKTAADSDTGVVRVGRWMGETEKSQMEETGKVVESDLTVTSVTSPPNPSLWLRQTEGTHFLEFNVPTSSIGASDGATGKICGPNSFQGRFKGITEMPAATDIVHTTTKLP